MSDGFKHVRGFIDGDRDYEFHRRKKRARAQRFAAQSKYCHHCKAGNLHWVLEKLDGQDHWYLVNVRGERHVCDMKGIADEFDKVGE